MGDMADATMLYGEDEEFEEEQRVSSLYNNNVRISTIAKALGITDVEVIDYLEWSHDITSVRASILRGWIK